MKRFLIVMGIIALGLLIWAFMDRQELSKADQTEDGIIKEYDKENPDFAYTIKRALPHAPAAVIISVKNSQGSATPAPRARGRHCIDNRPDGLNTRTRGWRNRERPRSPAGCGSSQYAHARVAQHEMIGSDNLDAVVSIRARAGGATRVRPSPLRPESRKSRFFSAWANLE